jgi:hypothetical protein
VRCFKSRYYSDLKLDGISKKSLKVSFQRLPKDNYHFSLFHEPVTFGMRLYNVCAGNKRIVEPQPQRRQQDREFPTGIAVGILYVL